MNLSMKMRDLSYINNARYIACVIYIFVPPRVQYPAACSVLKEEVRGGYPVACSGVAHWIGMVCLNTYVIKR